MTVLRVGPHPLALHTLLAVALAPSGELVSLPGERERRVIPAWSTEAGARASGALLVELRPALAIAEAVPIGWSLGLDPNPDQDTPWAALERLKGRPAQSVLPALVRPRALNLRSARVVAPGSAAAAGWFPGRTTLPMKSCGGGGANVVIAEDEADAQRLADIARARLGDRYSSWQIVAATPDELPKRVREMLREPS